MTNTPPNQPVDTLASPPQRRPPLVEVEGLVKKFRVRGERSRSIRAVDDISFAIREGETFGLVGESGSGKSTVARLLLRLLDPTSGRVRFDSKDVFALEKHELRELRRDMQIVFQDPHDSLNRRKTVSQIISMPMLVAGVKDRADRVNELLDLVGLRPQLSNRYPHQLSGGQAQRVGIARALAMNPRFVILDEAVSAVDVSVSAQILNLLRDLQQRLGLTYLFISHDLSLVRYMCDRLAVMYQGAIVESGSREDLFANPQHPYTHALIGAIPVPDPVRERARRSVYVSEVMGTSSDVAPGCRFHLRCPVGMDRAICRTVEPDSRELRPGHFSSCHFPQTSESILEFLELAPTPGEHEDG